MNKVIIRFAEVIDVHFRNESKLAKSQESEVVKATGEQPVGYASGSCRGATSSDRKSLPCTIGPNWEYQVDTIHLITFHPNSYTDIHHEYTNSKQNYNIADMTFFNKNAFFRILNH